MVWKLNFNKAVKTKQSFIGQFKKYLMATFGGVSEPIHYSESGNLWDRIKHYPAFLSQNYTSK